MFSATHPVYMCTFQNPSWHSLSQSVKWKLSCGCSCHAVKFIGRPEWRNPRRRGRSRSGGRWSYTRRTSQTSHCCRESDGNLHPAQTIPNFQNQPMREKGKGRSMLMMTLTKTWHRGHARVKIKNLVTGGVCRHLFEPSVRVEDPAFADGEQEEDHDDAESSPHLGSHPPRQ